MMIMQYQSRLYTLFYMPMPEIVNLILCLCLFLLGILNTSYLLYVRVAVPVEIVYLILCLYRVLYYMHAVDRLILYKYTCIKCTILTIIMCLYILIKLWLMWPTVNFKMIDNCIDYPLASCDSWFCFTVSFL